MKNRESVNYDTDWTLSWQNSMIVKCNLGLHSSIILGIHKDRFWIVKKKKKKKTQERKKNYFWGKKKKLFGF